MIHSKALPTTAFIRPPTPGLTPFGLGLERWVMPVVRLVMLAKGPVTHVSTSVTDDRFESPRRHLSQPRRIRAGGGRCADAGPRPAPAGRGQAGPARRRRGVEGAGGGGQSRGARPVGGAQRPGRRLTSGRGRGPRPDGA